MNLEESDAFIEKRRKNLAKKRMVLGLIILCSIAVVILIIAMIYLKYQDSLKLKMYVDGKEVPITSTLLTEVDGVAYINVKELSKLVGYDYTKGEYGKYNEDINSCYLSNGFEIVSMTEGIDTYTKYMLNPEIEEGEEPLKIGEIETAVKSLEGASESYLIEHPVVLLENALYMDFSNISNAFNIQVNTSEENRIRIYTLEALVNNVLGQMSSLGYTEISGVYENLRAVVYNMVVVGNGSNFGVLSLKTGEEIISMKYNEIVFVQNVQEFLVTAENTVGLLSNEGATIIKPTEYDEISVLNEVKGLYLVKKDQRYGVLDRKGNVVVYVEYDEIGYKNAKNFTTQEIPSYSLLFDSVIPVEKDSKYGLYDIEGNEVLKTVYDGLGYETKTTDVQNEESVLVIPASTGIMGIVVNLNEGYGIFDVTEKKLVIPTSCSRIYSITKSGKTTYYMEYSGEQIELEGYLDAHGMKNVRQDTNIETSTEDVTEDSYNTTNTVYTDE